MEVSFPKLQNILYIYFQNARTKISQHIIQSYYLCRAIIWENVVQLSAFFGMAFLNIHPDNVDIVS